MTDYTLAQTDLWVHLTVFSDGELFLELRKEEEEAWEEICNKIEVKERDKLGIFLYTKKESLILFDAKFIGEGRYSLEGAGNCGKEGSSIRMRRGCTGGTRGRGS